jgi:hypothetical protein
MTSPINLFLGINLLHCSMYLIASRRARSVIPSRPTGATHESNTSPTLVESLGEHWTGIPVQQFQRLASGSLSDGVGYFGQLEKLRRLSALAMPTTCLCGNRTAPVGRISSPHSIDFRNPKKGHMSPLLRKADDQCAHVVSGCGNNREGEKGGYD